MTNPQGRVKRAPPSTVSVLPKVVSNMQLMSRFQSKSQAC